MDIPYHTRLHFTSLRRLACVLAWGAFVVFPIPLSADPTPTLNTVRILDRGNELVLNWHFYYNQYPEKFVLREKQSQPMSLLDPATLEPNLHEIISVAFDLRLDGRPIQPSKPPELTIAPDKGCDATFTYPGRPGAVLEIRMPGIDYFPAFCVTSYQIFNVNDMGNGLSGDTLGRNRAIPYVVSYRQSSSHGSASPAPLSSVASPDWRAFKSQLRTAWINSNWLFICLILLLMCQIRPVALSVVSMIGCWLLILFLSWTTLIHSTYRIPETALAVPTVIIAGVAAPRTNRISVLLPTVVAAALLNAFHDIQPLAVSGVASLSPPLLGIALGFIASLTMVLVLLIPLVHECRKLPEFQSAWAPRISWAIAGLALLLPWIKLFFNYR